MTAIVEKVEVVEVLVADFGKVKLYKIVEKNEQSSLESVINSEG
jgi:hypothetical protein